MAKTATKVTTPEATLTFQNLLSPRKEKDGTVSDPPVFDAVLAIPKDSDISAMVRIANEALQEKFGKDAKFNTPPEKPKYKSPFRKETTYDLADYPFYEGCIMAPIRSKNQQPQVVGLDREPITDKNEVYNGMKVIASITAYAYDHPSGGKGVAFGVRNVMKVKDGETIGRGRSNPVDDFADTDTSGYEQDSSAKIKNDKVDLDDI